MTTVYGVTMYGGRHQIARQLKDLDDFPKEHVYRAAGYLVNLLFKSIGEIFSSASQIQRWFIQSSILISNKLGKTVEWWTPLGFPVAQPYFKDVTKSVMDAKLKDRESRPSERFVPNSMKQRNAFPPNYIHSLDSTHMMLTALHCQHRGLTYAAVHDSFWTHPSTVADMNKICREQFVGLHSQPLLKELSRFFVDYYLRGEYKELRSRNFKTEKEFLARLGELNMIKEHFESLPHLGDFDLRSVQKSAYFFS